MVWHRISQAIAAVLVLLVSVLPAMADTISVSPTRIAVPAGGVQTVMTVKAKGRGQSVVQIRAFRWVPGRPAHELALQQSVQVSPPITRLNAGQEVTVRIVRTGQTPLRGQECYRLLVDRVPEHTGHRREVALRIRHSIPLCFAG